MTNAELDDTIPTPGYTVVDEADPNPRAGAVSLPDAPPGGGMHAEGAVNEFGQMLRPDGTPAPTKLRVS